MHTREWSLDADIEAEEVSGLPTVAKHRWRYSLPPANGCRSDGQRDQFSVDTSYRYV